MQRRRVRAASARLDLDTGTFRVIRTVVEVNGHTAFKLYPKSGAGRRTVPLPDWLLTMLRTPCDIPLVAPGCYFSIRSKCRCGAPFAHVSGCPFRGPVELSRRR